MRQKKCLARASQQHREARNQGPKDAIEALVDKRIIEDITEWVFKWEGLDDGRRTSCESSSQMSLKAKSHSTTTSRHNVRGENNKKSKGAQSGGQRNGHSKKQREV
jgi:hypothetical protein